MGNIFRLDSPLVRFLAMVANFICLNILWLIGSIPVITAGASTVAMYSVLIGYITGKDDAVLKPFFRAFKENFRTVTPAWILTLLIGGVMAAEIFYLSVSESAWIKVVFYILLAIYASVASYLYPIFARYHTTAKQALLNSFILSMRHLFSSICVVSLNALPVVLAVAFPKIFWATSILWTFLGISLTAYLNLRILLPIFKKYEPAAEETKSSNQGNEENCT